MLGLSSDFSNALLAWYDVNCRDLPWRTSRGAFPDPYHVLVSELMLQQTLLATVIPYFHRFIAQFPTIQALAGAEEQQVLRLWQGLGYYSRARNLQNAARRVVEAFAGRMPRDVEALLSLPGVGRYTAGAIASLAYDVAAPILDGNVARVICRIDKIITDPREKLTNALLWTRAENLLPHVRPGDFNSSLMELGATVCTPRSPRCLICPVARHCQACLAGLQHTIPAKRKAKPTPLIRRQVWCIAHGEKWLVEQRPATGRWAGMWQFATIDPGQVSDVAKHFGIELTRPLELETIRHSLTHRRYEFEVFACRTPSEPMDSPHAWRTLLELDRLPMPRPHLKIGEILKHLAPD